MGVWKKKLRTKSLLALVAACVIALGPSLWIGWELLERGRAHFGEAYAVNFTLLNAQRIESPLTREMALSHRFADSLLLRRWLQNPESQQAEDLFFEEAEGFREDFRGQNYFVIDAQSLAYYYNGEDKDYSQAPRYYLDPESSDDAWFFNTMQDVDTYILNVNVDTHLEKTQVWIDVLIWEDGRKIGMAGTGMELSSFLQEFLHTDEPGVTPMILNASGMVQAHPEPELIALGSAADASKKEITLQSLVRGDGQSVRRAMEAAKAAPETVQTAWAELDGTRQLVALTWIPELEWHVVSAVDLHAAQVINGRWIAAGIAGVVALFGVLLVVFGYGVDRLVLQPLNKLHHSATVLSRGEYDVSLPPAGDDEIGDLTRAFGVMVEQVKSHTRELEARVEERTQALQEQSRLLEQAKEQAEAAHAEKAEALHNVMESIQYAQTIQQASLSTQEQLRELAPESFTLWQPKDVISGDMIWSAAVEDGFVLAVVDCTGHGVPGGIMTMAAVSALDRVVSLHGVREPQRVLQGVSRVVQGLLANQAPEEFSEDGLDMGLCVYSRTQSTLYFTGSRLGLLYDDGDGLRELKGDRQSLGYPSSDPDYPFQTHAIAIHGRLQIYLTTDGLVDQIGEETGLPLGKRRLRTFLQQMGEADPNEQKQALQAMLSSFQGGEEQRDDITVVGLRLTAEGAGTTKTL